MRRVTKVLAYTVISIFGILVILTLGGYALPSDIEVETEHTVKGTPEELFEFLPSNAGIRAWWSTMADAPQLAAYPKMSIEDLDGPTQGEGASVGFVMGGTRTETWTIKEVDAPHRVVYDVDFGSVRVTRTLELTSVGDQTRIRWHESGTIHSPLMRWFTLFSHPPVDNFKLAMDGLSRAASVASTQETPPP